jgi:hypothetical protein
MLPRNCDLLQGEGEETPPQGRNPGLPVGLEVCSVRRDRTVHGGWLRISSLERSALGSSPWPQSETRKVHCAHLGAHTRSHMQSHTLPSPGRPLPPPLVPMEAILSASSLFPATWYHMEQCGLVAVSHLSKLASLERSLTIRFYHSARSTWECEMILKINYVCEIIC